jgi:hypothetical protein
MVEQSDIVPILGDDLYQALITAIEAETDADPLPEAFKDLLHQCRMAIGPLFCYYHADKSDVLFSDAGMQRVETQTNKTAYQEQRTKFKEANLAEGEKALELLIQFLEKNMDNYEEWTDSANFKRYRSLFIKTGTEFKELYPSHSPYRNYWAMRSKMQDVEENNIRPFLGDELFEELKEQLLQKEPDLTDEELKLIEKLKKAIANFTVAFSIPLLNVRIASNGITIPAATTFSTNDVENTRSGITDKMFSTIIRSCNDTGAAWLNNSKKYLSENKTAFATWIGFVKDSSDDNCYKNGTGGAFGLF